MLNNIYNAVYKTFSWPSAARPGSHRYAKLGLMGVTVLYASGDDGVAGEISAPALQCVPATKLSFYRKR